MIPKISVSPLATQEQQQAVLDGVQALDEEGGGVHQRASAGAAERGEARRHVQRAADQSLQPRAGSASAFTATERNSLLLPLTSRR